MAAHISLRKERGVIRVRPIFAWYDFWVGAFFDRSKRRLYLFPVPCFGIVISKGEGSDG